MSLNHTLRRTGRELRESFIFVPGMPGLRPGWHADCIRPGMRVLFALLCLGLLASDPGSAELTVVDVHLHKFAAACRDLLAWAG